MRSVPADAMSHSPPGPAPLDCSIVIPAFNRVGPLRLTLRSAARAAAPLAAEVILVDDGSTPPLAAAVDAAGDVPLIHLRQANQGSIVARCAGMRAARGEFVLFLDSDDLIHPEKLTRQIAIMRAAGSDLSYSDMARYRLDDAGDPVFEPGEKIEGSDVATDFFLRIQPLPHNPVYRRDYLLRHLSRPLVPVRRSYDPVGDVWLYYNLLPFPARIVKVDHPLTAVGVHDENRYSRHWEQLGVAALGVAGDFFARCPRTPDTAAARIAAGESAFASWRRLPYDFHPGYDARMLALWRQAPRGPRARLGGTKFRLLATVLGPVPAGRVLRRLNGHSYASCRTLDDGALTRLLQAAGF